MPDPIRPAYPASDAGCSCPPVSCRRWSIHSPERPRSDTDKLHAVLPTDPLRRATAAFQWPPLHSEMPHIALPSDSAFPDRSPNPYHHSPGKATFRHSYFPPGAFRHRKSGRKGLPRAIAAAKGTLKRHLFPWSAPSLRRRDGPPCSHRADILWHTNCHSWNASVWQHGRALSSLRRSDSVHPIPPETHPHTQVLQGKNCYGFHTRSGHPIWCHSAQM